MPRNTYPQLHRHKFVLCSRDSILVVAFCDRSPISCIAQGDALESALSKFKVKLRLEGLELGIEGSRDDASLISRNVGQQIGQLLKPIDGIIEAEISPSDASNLDQPVEASNSERKKRRRKPPSASGNGDNDAAIPIEFRHDPEKFGSPTQQWKTLDKCLWLLYVVGEQTDIKEIANATLINTFNKHFRQSGQIVNSNASRDLGRGKTRKPSLVGQDTTKTPPVWFLTEEGRKRAQVLILGDRTGSE